jgi:hypothetical protein
MVSPALWREFAWVALFSYGTKFYYGRGNYCGAGFIMERAGKIPLNPGVLSDMNS